MHPVRDVVDHAPALFTRQPVLMVDVESYQDRRGRRERPSAAADTNQILRHEVLEAGNPIHTPH